ncbi:hypothetical protein ACK280_25350 [Mycobacterium sherrisii]|uniref:hypothetical protein n=1 Tax=Mycobacterium sherrisii TaxID=243061 RepID=UPI003974F19E
MSDEDLPPTEATPHVTVEDLRRAANAFSDLGDPELMAKAWGMNTPLEDKLRQTTGYIEQLQHDAAHPEAATEFMDWTNPERSD